MGRIIWQLLRRIDEPTRFQILCNAINAGTAVSTIVGTVATLGQQHGKYGASQPRPEEERFVTASDLEQLEDLSARKIEKSANNNSLLKAPQLSQILYRWQNWANSDEVKAWVQSATGKDEDLLEFLAQFLQRTFIHTISDVTSRGFYRLDPKWVEPFVDPEQIIDRARTLLKAENLPERQRLALTQFTREYDLRRAGKNPDDIDSWKSEESQ